MSSNRTPIIIPINLNGSRFTVARINSNWSDFKWWEMSDENEDTDENEESDHNCMSNDD